MNANDLLAQIPVFPDDPVQRAAVVALVFVVTALVVRLLFRHLVHAFVRTTETDVDDRLAAIFRGPVFWSIIVLGLWLASVPLEAHPTLTRIVTGVLATSVVLSWSLAVLRASRVILETLSRNADRLQWIQPATVPLLDMVVKFLVAGAAIYLVCVAWSIPLTSWLASAGIIGIAVGFAARDTLANLFSGVFILADAPYRIGDFVILDNELRGEVQEIGLRSTRILTRDDIQITVPNAVIANARIVNETGGPSDRMRVRVRVSAAYGSDVDQVRDVLLSCAEGASFVVDEPEPRVRFRAFGESGLDFELLAWIERPVYRGRVLDDLNRRVYKSFAAAGIEIPYAKRDVYVKELPRISAGAADGDA